MKRRVLLLLTALIAAAMMSVGPAFAHGNHNECRWDGHRWHDHDHNRGDCDDNNRGGGPNIPRVIVKATTSWI